jgi:hypothetical protein
MICNMYISPIYILCVCACVYVLSIQDMKRMKHRTSTEAPYRRLAKRRKAYPVGVNVCGFRWDDVYSQTTPMARRAWCLRIRATTQDMSHNCDVEPN